MSKSAFLLLNTAVALAATALLARHPTLTFAASPLANRPATAVAVTDPIASVPLAVASSAPGEAVREPAQVVELELWTWALRPWFNQYMADLVAGFEKENPGVKVRWVDVPGDAIVRKFVAAGAAGKLPDVVNLPDKTFLRFANLGGLYPLDGHLPGDPDAVYVKAALDQCRPGGGKLFGLPWYLSTEISITNRALLAEGGLTVETLATTWDGLLEQAGPFRQKTGKHLFIMRLGEVDLLNTITTSGLSPIVPREDGVGYRGNLTDPAVVAVIEKWVSAYRADLLPRESATGAYPDVVQAFKDQRVALLNADAVRSVRADTPKVYEQLEVRPGIVGKIGKTNVSAVMIGVGRTTRHPELAARLAWYMTSPPWQERLAKQASRVPSTKASLLLEDFAKPADITDKLRLALGTGAEQLRTERSRSFIPPTGRWPDLEKSFSEGGKRMLLEGADVRATLAAIQAEWEVFLAQEAAMMRK